MFKALTKRTMDLALGAFALALAGPVMLLAAVLIRCTSEGPVFFRQTRIGRGGRPFELVKFRTMVPGAEALRPGLEPLNEQSGPVFKMRADPRVSGVGRWLRRYSIDELPQLWNVLRGDMSLVGPRPQLPTEVAGYAPPHHRRHSVRPGLTCWWQVLGRDRIGFEEWMRLDLHYVDTWNPLLDLWLMLRTIPVVLRGEGH